MDVKYENHLDDKEGRWFAVHTKFRSEKAAVKRLEANGVEAYLPIKSVVRHYQRKIRKTELPLISSFVFVRIVKTMYAKVLETEYVAGFLKFGGNLLSIPDGQIELIKRLLGTEDLEMEVTQTAFYEGDEVEIDSGPLLGLRGKLVSIQGKERVLVDLVNSGYSLQLIVDKKLLRRV